MASDNIRPGVGPDGTASDDYLDAMAVLNNRRDELLRSAAEYQRLGNPGARTVCLHERAWLDEFAARLAGIEARYYARHLLIQGRKKASDRGQPTEADEATGKGTRSTPV